MKTTLVVHDQIMKRVKQEAAGRVKRVASCFLMAAAIVSTAAAGRNTGAAAVRTGMDPERLAKIRARMQSFVDQGTIAGVVTLVARRGVVASLEAVGYQDLETQKPMRTDTIFQVRSMTKSVTAVGIMILLEEGRLNLSDPVEKHVPEFRGIAVTESRQGETARTKQPWRAPTIRDLLTHTAGVVNDLPEALRERMRGTKSLADSVAVFAQQPLEFEPGAKFFYSDLGYATLGRIIEVVSDQPYEKFLKETIFEPLGMKDSSLLPPLEKLDRVASTYTLKEGKLVKSDYYDISNLKDRLKIPRPSSSMFSTASDMFSFYKMMLNGGRHNGRRILSRASVEVMTQVHTGELVDTRRQTGTSVAGEKANYGLGWIVARDPGQTLRLTSIGSYGHGGLLGTHGWVDPKKDLVRVFLIQRAWFPAGSVRWQECDVFMAMAAAAIVD